MLTDNFLVSATCASKGANHRLEAKGHALTSGNTWGLLAEGTPLRVQATYEPKEANLAKVGSVAH